VFLPKDIKSDADNGRTPLDPLRRYTDRRDADYADCLWPLDA
jgi:hypothetical protein